MEITSTEQNGVLIALVRSDNEVITDAQSALDFIATVAWETGSYHIVVGKSAITDDFFDLSTKLAGEVLQKFINYRVKIAIVGDFSTYSSKSLQAFIRESNKGHQVFFVSDENEAMERLSHSASAL